MDFFKMIVGGVIAGAIGAAIWAGIEHFTHYQVGYVAWGVGAAVGYGVNKAAGDRIGVAPGVIAAFIAILSLLAGKFVVAELGVQAAIPKIVKDSVSPQNMMELNANQICVERGLKGQKVAFRPGMNLDKASHQADFPPDVWKEAQERWTKLTPVEQQQRMAERQTFLQEMLAGVKGNIRQKAFEESFGVYDLLWFFLAVGSAFKIGANAVTSD